MLDQIRPHGLVFVKHVRDFAGHLIGGVWLGDEAAMIRDLGFAGFLLTRCYDKQDVRPMLMNQAGQI
jgi:hypothetical protein